MTADLSEPREPSPVSLAIVERWRALPAEIKARTYTDHAFALIVRDYLRVGADAQYRRLVAELDRLTGRRLTSRRTSTRRREVLARIRAGLQKLTHDEMLVVLDFVEAYARLEALQRRNTQRRAA